MRLLLVLATVLATSATATPMRTTPEMRYACGLAVGYLDGTYNAENNPAKDDPSETNAAYCIAWFRGWRDSHALCQTFREVDAMRYVLDQMAGGEYDDLDFFGTATVMLWQRYPCTEQPPA